MTSRGLPSVGNQVAHVWRKAALFACCGRPRQSKCCMGFTVFHACPLRPSQCFRNKLEPASTKRFGISWFLQTTSFLQQYPQEEILPLPIFDCWFRKLDSAFFICSAYPPQITTCCPITGPVCWSQGPCVLLPITDSWSVGRAHNFGLARLGPNRWVRAELWRKPKNRNRLKSSVRAQRESLDSLLRARFESRQLGGVHAFG